MIAPMPETRTAIVLLNGSSIRPNRTWKMRLRSLQVNSAPKPFGVEYAKTKQLHIKLTITATIEIELLNTFLRRVNTVMTIVLASGAIRISHGRSELTVFAKTKLE